MNELSANCGKIESPLRGGLESLVQHTADYCFASTKTLFELSPDHFNT